jgi:hypothetical protein
VRISRIELCRLVHYHYVSQNDDSRLADRFCPASCDFSFPSEQREVLGMRWFLASVAIAILFFVDRKYAGGRGAQEIFAVVQGIGSSVNRWSNDLLQPLRR